MVEVVAWESRLSPTGASGAGHGDKLGERGGEAGSGAVDVGWCELEGCGSFLPGLSGLSGFSGLSSMRRINQRLCSLFWDRLTNFRCQMLRVMLQCVS